MVLGYADGPNDANAIISPVPQLGGLGRQTMPGILNIFNANEDVRSQWQKLRRGSAKLKFRQRGRIADIVIDYFQTMNIELNRQRCKLLAEEIVTRLEHEESKDWTNKGGVIYERMRTRKRTIIRKKERMET
ncbi:uncharacterized protein LOC117190700 [Drosophila miranda]|uniref:uncharacterized protein LOC117190700 n=1 Tax=Drosophila miranda TaxID=7229 RepID=UPI00143F58E7|nr:uncharacterized protein LOC117190700 [Drosophila miranda]